MMTDSRSRPPVPHGARVALVVNPAARQGHDRDAVDDMARQFGERFTVEIVTPPTADAVEAGVRAASATHDAIVVVGGDGTINRAANGLAGSALPLGIVPMGTGNDFAQDRGIPTAPARAVRRILDGRTTAVDLVRVNGRVYCTVGVIGIAADGALTVAGLTDPGSLVRPAVRLLGDSAYRAAGLWHVLKPGSFAEVLTVTAEGGGVVLPPTRVHGVFVTNTSRLGGGLVVPVGADPSDGIMEIAAVPRMPRARLLSAFARFASGRPLRPDTLRVWRGTRAVIACPRAVRFSADGDFICESDRFDLEVLPGALTLIA